MEILVSGATGFLGTHLCRALKAAGHRVQGFGSKDCDLRDERNLERFNHCLFDQIFHLAAWTQAGDFCLHHAGEQWLENQKINTTMLSWWHKRQPQAKLIAIGTSCCYEPGQPHSEENFLFGRPTESLVTYAFTKRMLYAGLLACHQQFGHDYLYLIPSTLYGPDYHLDGRQMHFIFDLLRKIYAGKYDQQPVVLWGDGGQGRELIHIKDFISITLKLAEQHRNDIINIGSGAERSIRSYAEELCEIIGYDPALIQYDQSCYVGAQSKVLVIDKLRRLLPNLSLTSTSAGFKELVDWYRQANLHRTAATFSEPNN